MGDRMGVIARWTIYWPENLERDTPFVGNGPGEPLVTDEQPGYERVEVVPADQLRGAVEENERLRERVASLMLDEPSKTAGLYAAIDELQARFASLEGGPS